jgi:hypothetical protein
MTETPEALYVEKTACYILELPQTAKFHHAKLLPDENVYKYYLIEDEDGARYVYTDERAQEFDRKMKLAAKRRREQRREAAGYHDGCVRPVFEG